MTVKIIGRSDTFEKLSIPLFRESVPAGFPSPASDYCEQHLDLNDLCITNPPATYFVQVEGDSMTGAGIFPGDILVVDRSIDATHGDIVVAALNNEFTVKKLELQPTVRLMPMSPNHQPIELSEEADLTIFGVATNVIHSLRKR
ncbi:MAG: UV protection and mutation protein [Desulfuromonas sp.]|mgnify:CR=1 FL=1|nr:MAG: UV protection and mutation protein [Desulfuromonas sp.]